MTILFQFLGGLGMFLFGMKIMSEGLQKIAGKNMRRILGMVSNNRLVGCAVGTIVAGIMQSSSATTVMLVSFVNAGLITLRQALGVILGANVGTTVTAQLIAFKIQELALPAIAVGAFLKFFRGSHKRIYAGDVLLGFGLIFYGLATMSSGFAPLKTNPEFIAFFTKFNADSLTGILLCVLTGTALTMILQSSSATVGITMTLASQGLLTFESSVALILGDNIGTTITAELASIGGNICARQTARAHTLFNVIGVLTLIVIFNPFVRIIQWMTATFLLIGPPDMIVEGVNPHVARYIANSHTFFNVFNAIFFLIFLPYLEKLASWLTPHRKVEAALEEIHHIKYMDTRYIETPSVALSQAAKEITRMSHYVKRMFEQVIQSIKERKSYELAKWLKREENLNILRKEITLFLLRLTQGSITPEESKEMRRMMRMSSNLERIGDAINDIAKWIEELIEMDLHLSQQGMRDYEKIANEVRSFLCLFVNAMETNNNNIIPNAQEIDNNINRFEEDMKEAHLIRLQNGTCELDQGLLFVNILSAFKRMGGYSYNISQAVAGQFK